MFVKRVCYPVKVLGPGNRIGIWLAGCNRKCPGCMSPELQTTDGCKDCSLSEVQELLKRISESNKIDGITISGGEPFLQAEELHGLVQYIRERISDDIIIYTGYQLRELKEMRSPHVEGILSSVSVLIDGEYVEGLNDGIGLRGSSNQQIHIFRNHEKYAGLLNEERKLQTFRYNGQILVVGIR